MGGTEDGEGKVKGEGGGREGEGGGGCRKVLFVHIMHI